MRILFFFLLLANLTLFGYIELDNASRGERARLDQQVHPEKIRLLSPQQVAALAPAPPVPPPPAGMCVQWGPFTETERARAMAELAVFALGTHLTERRADSASVPLTNVVIRDPPGPVMARLRDLSASFPRAEVRVGSCE